VFKKYVSDATDTVQLKYKLAKRPVVLAVAVTCVYVVPVVVGVPEIVLPLNETPVGNAFAAYCTPKPAADVADNDTLDIGEFVDNVYDVLLDGEVHVTTSGTIAIVTLEFA
jgi:hypothetical protein